ncbi:hypothetical protein FSARC_12147 [Fusarium sarcochroum]|uniref:Alcohol dehydrogenase-like N-terminal domain-containing protein n=1 Tax=Fusarium sarcochroum TaxID=1208366 RepID=A0A8H4TAR3_9HYPO|nr:hypothetical protein FSARC_12147 [Fusarium sarcochroum]
MPHFAAIIPTPQGTIEVKEIDTPQPGPYELLIKNEIIALQPIDAKIAKLSFFPVEYPAVLGSSFAGTVEKIGAEVTGFSVGDKVVAAKALRTPGNSYSAFQQYALAIRLIGNLTTVVALFNVALKLAKPDLASPLPAQDKRILAGYDVVTTSSSRNKVFATQLGATKIISHSQPSELATIELISAGPYDIVFDAILLPETIKVAASVLEAQGGGEINGLLPASDPETLPTGVTHKYQPWSLLLEEERNVGLLDWSFHHYLPQALAQDSLLPVPERKISGGLSRIDDAFDLLMTGVSNEKVVLDPWE